MKVLIIPMAAMAETAGPGSRCKILAEAFCRAGMEVGTCMARDVNFAEIDDIRNYALDVPTPMGMPSITANLFFPLVQKLGITARKTVKSFDQVLFFTGNLDKRYLRRSVESIRAAIRDFRPDVVYSEFNVSAIIAAKLENVRLFTTVSFPTQKEYACEPKLAKGLNQLLAEWKLPATSSALELFEWADECFCPSVPELEPFEKKNVVFLGALKHHEMKKDGKRDKIIVYMGNGTISASKMLKEVKAAFDRVPYQIYVASKSLEPMEAGNLHVAPRWDFNKLLDEAVLFLNHGGQNSMVDGLLHGVPQIMVPGKVFERQYNAKSLEKAGAGKMLSHEEFRGDVIRRLAEEIIASAEMRERACMMGEKMMQAGGVQNLVARLRGEKDGRIDRGAFEE